MGKVAAQRLEVILRLTFRGKRFDGDGLQLAALPALVALNEALQSFARVLWRQKRGGKARVASDETLDIRLRALTPGKSVTAEVIADVPTQLDLFSKLDSQDLRANLIEATVKLGDACSTSADLSTIETRLPLEVLPPFRRMFNAIYDGEELILDVEPARDLLTRARPTVDIRPVANSTIREAARSTTRHNWAAPPPLLWQRQQAAAYAVAAPTRPTEEFVYPSGLRLLSTPLSVPMSLETQLAGPSERTTVPSVPQEAPKVAVLNKMFKSMLTNAVVRASSTRETITGEVNMASLQGSATVRLDDHDVRVRFKKEDEKKITRALYEHESVRVRIRGPGEIDLKSGRLVKIVAEKVRIIEPTPAEEPTAERLELMASERPDELLRLIVGGELPPHLLSFAAESAGRHLPTDKIAPVLIGLLTHDFPTVREAAMYGLSSHRTPDTVAALQRIAETDHPILRAIAKGVLETFEEEGQP